MEEERQTGERKEKRGSEKKRGRVERGEERQK